MYILSLSSYDTRVSGVGGRRWSDEVGGFGGRAYFRVSPGSPAVSSSSYSSPSALTVKRIAREEAGIYRCRVDFKTAPTRNSHLNLTVIGKRLLWSKTLLSLRFLHPHTRPCARVLHTHTHTQGFTNMQRRRASRTNTHKTCLCTSSVITTEFCQPKSSRCIPDCNLHENASLKCSKQIGSCWIRPLHRARVSSRVDSLGAVR